MTSRSWQYISCHWDAACLLLVHLCNAVYTSMLLCVWRDTVIKSVKAKPHHMTTHSILCTSLLLLTLPVCSTLQCLSCVRVHWTCRYGAASKNMILEITAEFEFESIVISNSYVAAQTREEDWSGHLQSPGWLPVLLCGLMSDLTLCKHRKRVWPYMTLNVLIYTRIWYAALVTVRKKANDVLAVFI